MISSDPSSLVNRMVTMGALFIVIEAIVIVFMMVLWVYALVHCIKHRHDKDRLMWVLINLLGGPFGAALYLVMGRLKSDELPPDLSGLEIRPSPFFDHAAVQDEKERIRAIEKALWGSSKKTKS